MSKAKSSRRYPPETRARAVRMALARAGERASLSEAIVSVAAEVGCAERTLRAWVDEAQNAAIGATPKGGGKAPEPKAIERRQPKAPARKSVAARRGKAPEKLLIEAQRSSTTASDLLAEKLREMIIKGRLADGSALPSERELMAQYRCSRMTVREALLGLRAQDLVRVRRGRSGGSFVSSPSPSAVTRSLDQLIGGHTFRFIDLVTARHAIEPAAAAQAAATGSEEKLRALREACEHCENSVGDGADFVLANLRWHLALAEASGNPLFVAFLTSISNAMHKATEFKEFDLAVRKAVVGIHWQIYDAIQRRDPEAAHRRTARHIDAYSKRLETIA